MQQSSGNKEWCSSEYLTIQTNSSTFIASTLAKFWGKEPACLWQNLANLHPQRKTATTSKPSFGHWRIFFSLYLRNKEASFSCFWPSPHPSSPRTLFSDIPLINSPILKSVSYCRAFSEAEVTIHRPWPPIIGAAVKKRHHAVTSLVWIVYHQLSKFQLKKI